MQCKVGIIGRFGFGKELLNGQTVKTKTVTSAITDELGEKNIQLIDTYGGFKTVLCLPFKCFHAIRQCKNIVILPAHNGVRVIAPILSLLNCFYHKKLHYVVIGSWLNDLLKGKKFLAWCLKRFDWIYAETTSMKGKLEAAGFQNVVLMPNFKTLPILDDAELSSGSEPICRLCTFSRVMKEKGIGTAVEAVRAANAQLARTAYQLDIYGQVDEQQKQWFDDLKQSFPENVRYCGEIPFDESVSTLQNYHALLFPTQFYTEGIPGTIIDAYAAGIPVIASRWENFADIVSDETGIGYPFADPKGLEKVLLSIAEDISCLNEKKGACLHRAHDFTPEVVVHTLLSRLDL